MDVGITNLVASLAGQHYSCGTMTGKLVTSAGKSPRFQKVQKVS